MSYPLSVLAHLASVVSVIFEIIFPLSFLSPYNKMVGINIAVLLFIRIEMFTNT